jgi:hypothetical protein
LVLRARLDKEVIPGMLEALEPQVRWVLPVTVDKQVPLARWESEARWAQPALQDHEGRWDP